MGAQMIIIVDNRYEVGAAYAAAFDREGVAASVFKFAEVLDWFEGLSEAEISVISGFMIGMSDDRLRVLRGIRQKTKLPVIALSERRSLDETLELFGGGVDDVVAKPVHVRELLMRLHVIKSREVASGRVLDLPELVIFSDGRDALVAGTALALPRREKRILDCLADARGGWVTKSQMFHRVYGLFNEDIDENVIESHISRLRKRMRLRLGREVIEFAAIPWLSPGACKSWVWRSRGKSDARWPC